MINFKLSVKEPNELNIYSALTLFKHNQFKGGGGYHHSIPVEKINGVYILYHKGSIVRIGQSKDVYGRLNSHTSIMHVSNINSKNWDSFSIIPCKNDTEKFIIEGVLIDKYKPKLNRCITSCV